MTRDATAGRYRRARLPGLALALGAASSALSCALPGLPGARPVPSTPAARAQALADSLLHRDGPPVGLDVVQSLEFPPLRFDPPEPERFELSNGVTVFFLRDPALPLVDVFIDVRGGYLNFDRDRYAAATALLPLMRHGGTAELPPDSVDALLERNALGMSTSTNGGRMRLAVSGLSHQMDQAMDIWSAILLRPRFDSAAVERWRVRELEAVRRLPDLAGSLAVVEFNRLMYGDNPNGWRMREEDLARDRVRPPELRSIHRRTFCPENAVIGAAGDVAVEAMRAALERVLVGWAPCEESLAPSPPIIIDADPGVYVIHRPIPQSTVVVGQPGGVLLEESAAYFASRLANWVLGGSGFTSRLVSRLRTEEGLAYSAASIWGVARRHERILGAITHTKSESTVDAARIMIETFADARTRPPDAEELGLAREAILNGFVFGFSSTVEVVSRQVSYLTDGLPADWLARYLDGIREVDTSDVANVIRNTVDPDRFTILIVGDTTRFDASVLGPVQYLAPDGTPIPGAR